MKIKLPFWLSGIELSKLKDAAQAFFDYVFSFVDLAFNQLDAEHCHPTALHLLAVSRNVDRLKNEPLALFRKRVAFAFENAKDAGSTAGLVRIFHRLGIGSIVIDERIPGRDWDIVSISLSDEQLSGNVELLQQIVQKYGRTCRRYELTVLDTLSIDYACWEVGHTWASDRANF